MASAEVSAIDPKALAEGIVGKKCRRATFGYPDDLHLHCGTLIPYRNSKMSGKRKGSWLLGTSGTGWLLFTPQGVVSSKRTRKEKLKEWVKSLEGNTIEGFRISGNVLTVTFSNGHKLQVVPTQSDEKYDLPYWELFMPKRRHLMFGPHKRWTVVLSEAA